MFIFPFQSQSLLFLHLKELLSYRNDRHVILSAGSYLPGRRYICKTLGKPERGSDLMTIPGKGVSISTLEQGLRYSESITGRSQAKNRICLLSEAISGITPVYTGNLSGQTVLQQALHSDRQSLFITLEVLITGWDTCLTNTEMFDTSIPVSPT